MLACEAIDQYPWRNNGKLMKCWHHFIRQTDTHTIYSDLYIVSTQIV